MDDNNVFLKYIWLMAVALIGGVMGFYSKLDSGYSNKSLKSKIKLLLLGVFTSMFIAYIIFELSFYVFNHIGVSVAFGGAASFLGTDFVVKLEKIFFDIIIERFKRGK